VPPINLGRAGLPILQKNHEEGECLLLKGLDYLFFRRIMKWGSASFSSRKGWTVLTLEVEEGKCLLSYLGRAGQPKIQKTHEEGKYHAQFKNKCTLAIPSCGLFFISRGNIGTLYTCKQKVTRGIF
jgi:hypothetical protein